MCSFGESRFLFIALSFLPPLTFIQTRLGFGVPVTEPSLGMLIANGFEFMLSGHYWISFFPGIALALAIVGINLVGDHLRDILNPHNAR